MGLSIEKCAEIHRPFAHFKNIKPLIFKNISILKTPFFYRSSICL
jgi:hypothetical protein